MAKINILISDYLDYIIFSLENYRLSYKSEAGFDDKVMESINKMLPLKMNL